MPRRKLPNITTSSPFPKDRLEDFYRWVQPCKSFLRAMPRDQFLRFFEDVLDRGAYSLGIYGDGELGGVIVVEPTAFRNNSPTDANIAICLARRLWGCDVMQPLLEGVLTALFGAYPRLHSVTSNVVGTNWPEKRLVTALGSKLEHISPSAVELGTQRYDMHLYRLTKEDFFNGLLQRTKDHSN